MARKRISQQPLLAIFKSSGRGEFGVVSATAVNIWRVEQDLDYRVVFGGHTGPVIAVQAVNGAVVCCPGMPQETACLCCVCVSMQAQVGASAVWQLPLVGACRLSVYWVSS